MAALLAGFVEAASAETLNAALVRTYQGNPRLNAERARQRGTDENVPQALAGYRPQIIAGLSTGLQQVRNLLPDVEVQTATQRPWSIGLTVTQNLFNGFRTANQVRQSESQVRSGREVLRSVGQGVLLDAVTAYANVLGSQALVEAQRVNVTFLQETLTTTRRRLDAGDVTETDVAQAEARLKRGQADLNAAEVGLAINQSLYEQVTGGPPGRLASAEPIDRVLPRTREDASAIARREQPVILAAMHDVDVATAGIRIAESTLLPQVNIQGSVSRTRGSDTTLGTVGTDQAAAVAQATVPIYDGGLGAAQTRQAKELTTQARIVLEQVRNQSQTAVVSAWVTMEGARVATQAAEAEVRAAEIALRGIQREAQAGQRTTIDLLNAQQDHILARARLIASQRDRVIASYTLLSAIGRLDPKTLGLPTPIYQDETHYHQVRDAWHGLRTPSGK